MRKVFFSLLLCMTVVWSQEANDRARAATFARLLSDQDLGGIAQNAIERMGPAAVSGLIVVLADVNAPARSHAARMLGVVGKDSKEAKAALTRVTGDRDAFVSVAAASALLSLGDKSDAVIEGLARGLSHWDESVRRQAIDGLRTAGKEAKSAAPVLIRALDDRDPKVRSAASEVLIGLGIAVVQLGVDSDNAVQRAMSVEAIGRMREAKEFLPRLAKLLLDDSDDVKVAAAHALQRIGKDARSSADAISGLKSMAGNKNAHPRLRRAAIGALDSISPQGWDTVAVLRRLLRDREARTRAFAAAELGVRKSSAAKGDLALGLNDLAYEVRRASARALVQVAKDDPATFKLLLAGLRDQLLLSRRHAAEALGMLGRAASGAKSELEALTESDNLELADAARAALKRIG